MRGRWEDPYAALGLPRRANERQIRKAFRKIALRDHPDRNKGDPRAEERFKRASAAYQRLKESGWNVDTATRATPESESEACEACSDGAAERPQYWADGEPIHYPTPKEIAEVVAAPPQPRVIVKRGLRAAGTVAAVFAAVALDHGMGTTQAVEGQVIDRSSATNWHGWPGWRTGCSPATIETTQVRTELGTFTFEYVPTPFIVIVTTGRISGYRYVSVERKDE